MPYLQVVFLSCFIVLLCAKITNRVVRFIIFIFSYTLLILEIVSVGLTRNLVDYRFYNHISIGTLDFGFPFFDEIVFFVVMGLAVLVLFPWLSRQIRLKNIGGRWVFLLSIMLFGFMLLPGGIVNELLGIVRVVSASTTTFRNALSEIGIIPEKYITPDDLKATPGKNIIVISLESLEKGYMAATPELVPNLRKLANEWTFYGNVPSAPGSSWTAGSIYTIQTGFPAFFPGHGNDFFQHAIVSKITGLGQILNKAGYNLVYLMGKPEFAGVLDILKLYGFNVVSERNCLGKYPKTRGGLHDLDVFSEAKLQIKKLKKQKRPFALFISTVDTHSPNGIYDSRMESYIGSSRKGLEYSVSAIDYLVGDFVRFLGNEGLLNNTAVFLFPDHELMGGAIVAKLKRTGRGLFFLTNIKKDCFSKKPSEKIYQINFPRLIIEGSGIQSNAKFLTDFLNGLDAGQFIRKHARDLAALNRAALKRINFRNGILVSAENGLLQLSSGGFHAKFDVGQKKGQAFDVLLTPRMDFIRTRIFGSAESAFRYHRLDEKRLHVIVQAHKVSSSDKYEIIAYIGNKQGVGLISKGISSVKFASDEIAKVISSNEVIRGLSLDLDASSKSSAPLLSPDVLQVTSSGHLSMSKAPSLFRYKKKSYRLSRGLSLFSIKRERFAVETFDTYGSAKEGEAFVRRIKTLMKRGDYFIIAASDSAEQCLGPYRKELKKLGFEKLAQLDFREPYIAYSFDGHVRYETKGKRNATVSVIVPLLQSLEGVRHKNEPKFPLKHSSSPIDEWRKDRHRFIAHAGGQIGNHRYTNSLEALNASYEKGFRLFELDIIKTSDNIFVAAHDWKTWSKQTPDYDGELPPTLQEFKKHKIFGKYTSMDINRINAWFKKHPDAVLITDKVNSPVEFAEKFIDKKRLMMELFSLNAVRDGLKYGVTVMPNLEAVVLKMKGDRISVLKQMGVKYLTASRRTIAKKLNLFKGLKANGIKVYVFHVNVDKGKDEKYVLENEFCYVYGMYADNWFFQ